MGLVKNGGKPVVQGCDARSPPFLICRICRGLRHEALRPSRMTGPCRGCETGQIYQNATRRCRKEWVVPPQTLFKMRTCPAPLALLSALGLRAKNKKEACPP